MEEIFLLKDFSSLRDMLYNEKEAKQNQTTKTLNKSRCANQNMQNTENTAARNDKIFISTL